MSKGGDVPDAPDYSELIELAKEAYGKSNERGDEQWKFFKDLYEQNKPMFDKITDQTLGLMDKSIDDYDNYRQRRRNIFEPMEDALAEDAASYASPARQQFEAGKAEANVAAQFDQARKTARDRLETYGVDPSQTRQGALDLATRVAEASAQAGAGNKARQDTEALGRQLRSEAIAVGQGYPGYMAQSADTAGKAGGQAANTQLASTASAAQTQGTAPVWSGLANQALGLTGNIMNTQYQNQLGQYQAEAQESSGFGNLLGNLVGFGAKKIFGLAEGGVIPDDEMMADEDGMYLDPEMSPSGGGVIDDIEAETDSGSPARLNAGEFVVPEDVVSWLGEKGMQQIILKARKEMANGEQRPAQAQPMPPQQSYQSVGAIPEG